MSKEIKERMIGAVVTGSFVIVTFLVTAYFSSFETKASAESRYSIIDKKLTAIMCFLDKNDCLKSYVR